MKIFPLFLLCVDNENIYFAVSLSAFICEALKRAFYRKRGEKLASDLICKVN
jgi:hypothetical protein